jgi:hypothetical protein
LLKISNFSLSRPFFQALDSLDFYMPCNLVMILSLRLNPNTQNLVVDVVERDEGRRQRAQFAIISHGKEREFVETNFLLSFFSLIPIFFL